MIPLSANTAACLGLRVVGFTRRGVVVGVRLFAILLIVSNLPLNILLNALLLSVLKRAPVFMACLAGTTAPVFLSIFTPSLAAFLAFLVGVTSHMILPSSLGTTVLSYLARHCLPDRKHLDTALTMSATMSQLEMCPGEVAVRLRGNS